ncbi:MAG TPA: S41 family peptidase [Caulobacteraceae bacterium]|jgi:carboxyl-terminal processing protease
MTGALAISATATSAAAATSDYAADFDDLWRLLDAKYCFFGEKAVDWGQVRRVYGARARRCTTTDAFAGILRGTLNELYDAHTHMSHTPDGEPRYAFCDMWVHRDGFIEDVRQYSAAEAAGIVAGDHLTHIDGLTLAAATAKHRPTCLTRRDPEADFYAINVAASGRVGMGRTVTLKGGRQVPVPLHASPDEADVSWRMLPDNFGYIRISTFAGEGSVAKFDHALSEFKDTRGLILDPRRNGGGDTAMAKPMMGRFITEPKVYALMRRRVGRTLGNLSRETVEPRGPFTYAKPVVVLTDRWSASMAEGFPMGMRGIGRGVVVGRPMMGLGAAVFDVELKRTKLGLQYSAEPVYDVNDHPRWKMQPDVLITPGVDILQAGVSELRKRV